MKTEIEEEERADNLVVYSDGEEFEYYFDNFTEDNAPTEEVKFLLKVEAALLEKFSTKKIEVEVMKEPVNLV